MFMKGLAFFSAFLSQSDRLKGGAINDSISDYSIFHIHSFPSMFLEKVVK